MKHQTVEGFSKLSKEGKIEWVVNEYLNGDDSAIKILKQYWNDDAELQKLHDEFSENTISNFYMPFGLAPNFLINNELYAIPMAVEESSVNFLVSFNLPLFVGKQENINLKFNIENNKLIATNQANSHIQVNNLALVDANKKVVFKAESMNYLLAKMNYSYALKDTKITDPKKYSVQFFTDKNDDMVELKLSD